MAAGAFFVSASADLYLSWPRPPPRACWTRISGISSVTSAQGMGNAEIAEKLYISIPTVKTHIARILEKLQVSNRVQIAIAVVRD